MRPSDKVLIGLLLLVYVLILIYPTMQRPEIILISFDVEAIDNAEDVMELVDVMDKYDVKATFFVTGRFAEENKEVIREIHSRGHELGSHSYSHPNLRKLSYEEKKEQIVKSKEILTATADVVGFRAPYHMMDSESFELLKQAGYKYDASYFEGQAAFFAKPTLTEITISRSFIYPLSDYIMLEFYKFSPKTYLFFLKNQKSRILSFSFHPRVIDIETFEELIKHYQQKNMMFLRHRDL